MEKSELTAPFVAQERRHKTPLNRVGRYRSVQMAISRIIAVKQGAGRIALARGDFDEVKRIHDSIVRWKRIRGAVQIIRSLRLRGLKVKAKAAEGAR